MTLGPVMLDLIGLALAADEREMLMHPLVGGVILFSRNFESPEQLDALVAAMRASKNDLLICVDHEGGRVQRFRDGFTRLPPARAIGARYATNQGAAVAAAETMGWLMAAELRAHDIDFSFAPVLDLDYGFSEVIGDRAFGRDPEQVATLAQAYMRGMHRAGMAAVGKHFPGHGYVEADSHVDLPIDERTYEAMAEDILPFERLAKAGLDAVMPAHVIYRAMDAKPAGFSAFWLQDVLRTRLGFQGVIFSDDLNMTAAQVAGDFVARAQAALEAGCDMVLACNNRDGAIALLDGLPSIDHSISQERLMRMRGRDGAQTPSALRRSTAWRNAVKLAESLAPKV